MIAYPSSLHLSLLAVAALPELGFVLQPAERKLPKSILAYGELVEQLVE